MSGTGDHPERPRLLLLSGRSAWTDAARSEMATLYGDADLDIVAHSEDAARRLAPSGHGYTHLLLDPDAAGEWLATLVALSAGEDRSGVALVVLGADHLPDDSQINARFVPRPEPGWLKTATTAPSGAVRTQTAPDIAELREALSAGRIHARYQPIVRMADRMPVGLEALARLEHPRHGTIGPDLFVPSMEEAGLAWDLTRTMIDRAFADWPGTALRDCGMFMAINVPLDILLDAQALASLEARRDAACIPAGQIVIELTESRPLERMDELGAAVSRLRGWGFGLAIDDVGPEVRDHSALLDLNFTMLKLDKDLVRGSPTTEPGRTFLHAAIAAARRAGLTVIAEGVETPQIWARMAAAGVEQAQGFLVARPLPARAVPLWRDDWCSRSFR